MNILVTGASGFIGRHLVPFLQNKGHDVTTLTSKQANLTHCDALRKLKLPKFDQIYHLAAWTQAGDFCLLHGGEQWIINQQINTNVLAWWQKYQPQAKMIAFGTSVSYTTEEDLREDKYMMGVPSEKFYAYAMSKRMLLVGLQTLHKQFGMNYLYVIPSTVYGPNYHTDGRQLHFIYDLIRKIIRGKEYGEPVVLWGDGYQRRELVYIDDFTRTFYELNQKCSNDIFNIGAGEDYSIRDFAQIICKEVGYDFDKIQFDNSKYVGAKSKFFNVDKIDAVITRNNTNLSVGVREVMTWFDTEKSKFL